MWASFRLIILIFVVVYIFGFVGIIDGFGIFYVFSVPGLSVRVGKF